MRIAVHDYAGHAFTIQLSRWLKRQGHDVCYVYSADYETPRGDLRGEGAAEPRIVAIGQGRKVPKYDLIRRYLVERKYGRRAAAELKAFAPDVVLSGNTPPAIQNALIEAARAQGAGFVFWVQDIFSEIVERVLRKKLPVLGGLVAQHFRRFEFGLMQKSDRVVVISEDFVPVCEAEGVGRSKLVTIRNWAPLEDISPEPKDNVWARQQGIAGKFVFLFSGTLGLKHNPALLSELAVSLKDRSDAVVAVVSQGAGRQFLEEEKAAKGLDNLLLFDFQPFAMLPFVLASADVLIAILEPFAGKFSVPSKVLSYLCTARPLLVALPAENLASRTVGDAGAGESVSPDDHEGFARAARRLMDDAEARKTFGDNGRAYAEQTFAIDCIGKSFLEILKDAHAFARVPTD